MLAAGMPAGGLTSSSRTEARQWELYRNQGKTGWPKLAAHPSESKHVYRPNDPKDKGGRAVDVDDPTRAWLIKHGAAHGWTRTITSEPWHFEYDPSKDTRKDDDMALDDADKAFIRGLIRDPIVTDGTETVTYATAIRRSLAIVRRLETKTAAQDAQIRGLVGAVAALAKGDQFDEARLLAGVRAAAEQGIAKAIKDGVDIDVVVNPRS